MAGASEDAPGRLREKFRMLDVVNRLADGFVAVPVIEACRRCGLFLAMSSGPKSAAALANELHANEGHLRVALRLLEGLGWVDGSVADAFRLSPLGEAQTAAIPSDLDEMLAGLPGDVASGAPGLAGWLRRCASGWADHEAPHPMADLLDGALLAPVLGELSRRGGARSLDLGEDLFGPDSTVELLRLFEARGWAEAHEPRPRLNPAGAYLLESGGKLGVTLSYWPMLRQMDTLLFGNAASVFERDSDGHERHLDRRLNIFGSAAQHGGFFREMEDAVVDYFDSLPLEAQPSHIADLGCGDGTLLRRLHAAVATRARRGAALAQHPLTLIAADYNQASLDEAARNLSDLPHLTVRADIGDPSKFISELAANGVDPKAVLHVRSFVDHDRPLLPPRDIMALARWRPCRDTGAHVDAAGGAIEPAVAVQSLVEHLAHWREAVQGHGLLLLEVHCVQPRTIRRLNHATEALHFDAYHGFSGQHLVEASTFMLAAAGAGLVPQTHAVRRFPRLARYTRITLNSTCRGPVPHPARGRRRSAGIDRARRSRTRRRTA